MQKLLQKFNVVKAIRSATSMDLSHVPFFTTYLAQGFGRVGKEYLKSLATQALVGDAGRMKLFTNLLPEFGSLPWTLKPIMIFLVELTCTPRRQSQVLAFAAVACGSCWAFLTFSELSGIDFLVCVGLVSLTSSLVDGLIDGRISAASTNIETAGRLQAICQLGQTIGSLYVGIFAWAFSLSKHVTLILTAVAWAAVAPLVLLATDEATGCNECPVVRPPAKQQDQAADQGRKRPAASPDSWEQEPAWKKTATDSKDKSKGGYGDAKGGYEDAKCGNEGHAKGASKVGSTDAKGGSAAGRGVAQEEAKTMSGFFDIFRLLANKAVFLVFILSFVVCLCPSLDTFLFRQHVLGISDSQQPVIAVAGTIGWSFGTWLYTFHLSKKSIDGDESLKIALSFRSALFTWFVASFVTIGFAVFSRSTSFVLAFAMFEKAACEFGKALTFMPTTSLQQLYATEGSEGTAFTLMQLGGTLGSVISRNLEWEFMNWCSVDIKLGPEGFDNFAMVTVVAAAWRLCTALVILVILVPLLKKCKHPHGD